MATETIPMRDAEVIAPAVEGGPERPAPSPQALVPAAQARQRIQVQVDPDDPTSLYMDTGIFEQLQRVATLMARANVVPAHLRGKDKVSDCFLVTAQALRWRMDPFGVAQHTFVLKGKLGYEGKLVAAVINASGKLDRRLDYTYSGEGKARAVVVIGRLKGEGKDRTVDGTVERWATDNDHWRSDPDQMLAYRGAREWARRHMPEAVLGIQADEEVVRAVEMERRPDGVIAAARTAPAIADPLLESIGVTHEVPAQEATSGAVPVICLHENVEPPTKAGRSPVCTDCGEVLSGEKLAPCCGKVHGPGEACA